MYANGFGANGSRRGFKKVPFGSVLQCVVVCCSALQCVAANASRRGFRKVTCCSVLQCVAVRCSVLPQEDGYRHTQKGDVLSTWASRVTNMHEPCHTHEEDHFTNMKESCQNDEHVMSN